MSRSRERSGAAHSPGEPRQAPFSRLSKNEKSFLKKIEKKYSFRQGESSVLHMIL